MNIPPVILLALMLSLTAAALLAHKAIRAWRRRVMRRLALSWQMHYAESDLFNLARRIAADFPLPGAADLRVLDLIYASDEQRHRYLFTAQYTRGATERQHRESRAMSFSEEKESGRAARSSPVKMAPEGLPLIEQYRRLHDQKD